MGILICSCKNTSKTLRRTLKLKLLNRNKSVNSKMADGKMKWVDEKDWHGGAGSGRCTKEKIKTQLITAWETKNGKKWKSFAKGEFAKDGKSKNFDSFFDKSGEIQIKPHGQRGEGTETGIMWRELDVMKSAYFADPPIITWNGDKDAVPAQT